MVPTSPTARTTNTALTTCATTKLADVDEETAKRAIFITGMVSLFSEQFYFWQGGVLPTDHWERFRKDLCDFVMLPTVQPQVVANIGRGSYPIDFKHELIRCGVKVE